MKKHAQAPCYQARRRSLSNWPPQSSGKSEYRRASDASRNLPAVKTELKRIEECALAYECPIDALVADDTIEVDRAATKLALMDRDLQFELYRLRLDSFTMQLDTDHSSAD